VHDLVGAGFRVIGHTVAATPASRTRDLEAKVAELEREVAVWKALAVERERHLQDLRAIVRRVESQGRA